MNAVNKVTLVLTLAFIGTTIFHVLHLKKRGIQVLVLGKDVCSGLSGIIEYLYGPGLFLWLAAVIVHTLEAESIIPGMLVRQFYKFPFLEWIGAFCIAGGFALYISGLLQLGIAWRIGIDPLNPGRLVTTGIYSFSRNPIMLCLMLYGSGTWLVYPNALMLVFMIAIIASAHYQTVREEAFLSDRHGTAYRQYTKQVGRYITLFPKQISAHIR